MTAHTVHPLVCLFQFLTMRTHLIPKHVPSHLSLSSSVYERLNVVCFSVSTHVFRFCSQHGVCLKYGTFPAIFCWKFSEATQDMGYKVKCDRLQLNEMVQL